MGERALSVEEHRKHAPDRLACRVITVSDTRTPETDEGGDLLCRLLKEAGHRVAGRAMVRDEVDEIATAIEEAVAGEGTDAVILTGGTGIAPRDVTPEALRRVVSREIPGFGELFRSVSFREIGPAAMLSRATAGVAGKVVVAAFPGSPRAIATAASLLFPELPHLVREARK